MLTFPDPSRMFLTTDHPNEGPFLAYPQVIEWLKSRAAREAVLQKIHPAGREKTGLGSLKRELSLSDIITMTSWGPARSLGLNDRGHLGAGALADLPCYCKQADVRAMFVSPAWVMRRGERVVENGRIIAFQIGDLQTIHPEWDAGWRADIYSSLREIGSVQPEQYGLGEAYTMDAVGGVE